MGAKKRVLLDLGSIYVGDYIWVALMRSVNQGFVENGFDAATAAEFGKRRNPQYATCFDACGAVCLVLSLSLVILNLVVLNLWSHRLVVLRFGGIAGPQASLFQVAFILHLRFNV